MPYANKSEINKADLDLLSQPVHRSVLEAIRLNSDPALGASSRKYFIAKELCELIQELSFVSIGEAEISQLPQFTKLCKLMEQKAKQLNYSQLGKLVVAIYDGLASILQKLGIGEGSASQQILSQARQMTI